MATETLWKTLRKKIDKKPKPFVDNNLQIQTPDLDQIAPVDVEAKNKSIFSHYCRNISLMNDLSHIESELNMAMSEAQQTYKIWKKMQTKLAEMTNEQLNVKK